MNRKNLAHIWAQQTKPHGRAGNFYFDGPTVYSYGPHFPIARFIERNGRRAVLFTTRTYSTSTSQHISAARGALYGLSLPVFHLQNVTDTPRTELRKEYESRVNELAEKAARARTNGQFFRDQAAKIATEANACAQFFGFRWRLAVPELSPEAIAKIRARVAAVNKAEKEKREKREAAKLAEYNERVAKWQAGENVYIGTAGMAYDAPTMLRVLQRTDGDIVQTSRGAEVPADHARRIWPIIQRVVRTGQPYERNGHSEHVGEFVIDAIAADGTLRAGCHTIAFPELRQCAAALGCEVTQ